MPHDPVTALTTIAASLSAVFAAVANEFANTASVPSGTTLLVATVLVYIGFSCFTAVLNHIALKVLTAFCRHCWSAALLGVAQALFVYYYMPRVSTLLLGEFHQNATVAWNDLLTRVEPVEQADLSAFSQKFFRALWGT